MMILKQVNLARVRVQILLCDEVFVNSFILEQHLFFFYGQFDSSRR